MMNVRGVGYSGISPSSLIAKYVEYPNNKSKVIHLFHETLYTGLTRSFIALKRTSILVFKERLVPLSLGKSDKNKFAGTVLNL